MPNIKRRKFLFVFIIIFVLYCAVWSAYVSFRYKPFCKVFPTGTTSLSRDGYTYSVHKPPFLSFTGNLHISEYITIGEDTTERISADLLIWPRGVSDYEVGVGIIKTVTSVGGYSSNSICTDMMLDENMRLLDDTPENRELYEQNLDKIENLYHLAYDMWGILGLK